LVELSRRDEILLGCVDAATELRMKEVVTRHTGPATRWAAYLK
jgi:hypothetical protein